MKKELTLTWHIAYMESENKDLSRNPDTLDYLLPPSSIRLSCEQILQLK